jgi:hypothetical protein
MSTVLLHLSHLSQEDEVREGSLNPYLAVINQMLQDSGYRRPALGHYVDLLRKGFANVEVQDTSSAPVRMPLPPTVVHDILSLGLASSVNETLRQAVCIDCTLLLLVQSSGYWCFYLRAAISDCLLIGFIRATETLKKDLKQANRDCN